MMAEILVGRDGRASELTDHNKDTEAALKKCESRSSDSAVVQSQS